MGASEKAMGKPVTTRKKKAFKLMYPRFFVEVSRNREEVQIEILQRWRTVSISQITLEVDYARRLARDLTEAVQEIETWQTKHPS